MNDLVSLEKIGIKEVIIWRAFYENEIFKNELINSLQYGKNNT